MLKNGLFIIAILVLSCNKPDKKETIVDFADTVSSIGNSNLERNKVVYIAIASMTSPKETYIYYDDLIKYISKKVGHPIYIKQKKTYEEVNLLLENSEVDFAFICSGAFVDEYKKDKIKLLVAPEIDHKISYHAYIITQKGSKIEKFIDFENKSFAFTDPLSNTGRMYPLKKLAELNRDENDFFHKTVFTYGHDISIQMVNRGIIDGASVHGLIFHYLSLFYPEKVKNIKVIERSEAFGIPPVVTPKSLKKECFDKYQKIFLNIHKDSTGKKILEKLHINKFITVQDTLYKSVFQLKEYINKKYEK
ncbi:MAG: PhnD/SsuA/transferrin family substrate-binding protein [Bacteroidales bacterium]|nr:PhnD/SsuA/transferrin family substrate-binding protein [Bacteroidales bacterium]